MALAIWVLAIGAVGQIPPPETAAERSAPLRREFQAIREREAARLSALADGLEARGQAKEAETVRGLIEAAPPPDGPTRFVPLPEVIPSTALGLASVPAG